MPRHWGGERMEKIRGKKWIMVERSNVLDCGVMNGGEKENEPEKETKDIQGERKKTWGSRVS